MEIAFVIVFAIAAAQGRLRADFKDWGGRKMDAASNRLENRRAQLRNDSRGNGPVAWLARAPGRAALAAASGLWGAGRSLRQGMKEGAEKGRQEFADRYPEVWEKKQNRKARRAAWWRRRTRQADPVADPSATGGGPNLTKGKPLDGPGPAPAVGDRRTGEGRVDPLAAGRRASGGGPVPDPISVVRKRTPYGPPAPAGALTSQPKPDGYVSEFERDTASAWLKLDEVGRIYPPLTADQRRGFHRRAAGEAVPMDFLFKVTPATRGDGTPPAIEKFVQDMKYAVPHIDQDIGARTALPPDLRNGELVAQSSNEPQKFLPGRAAPVLGESYPTTPAPLRVVGSTSPASRSAGGPPAQKAGTPAMSGDVSSIDQALAVLRAAKQNATAYLQDAKAEIVRAQQDAQVADKLAGFATKADAPPSYQAAMRAAAEGPIAAVGAAKAKLGAAELSVVNIDKAIAENMRQKQVQEAARAAGGAMRKEAYQPQ